MAAEVILAGRADAVTAPVTVGQNQTVQLRIIGINTATLAHGHMVRRIEAGSANIAPSASKASLTVNGILGAQRIAVVLNQPQIVCIAECLDCRQVKRVAQRMCNHNCLGLGREGCFQFSNINVVLRNRHVHKHRHCAILDGRGHGGGETAGNSDNFIALLDLTVTQLRGSQSHKGDQVCGRTAVDQMRILYSNPLCKLFFKLICKTTSRQPEIQRCIGQRTHFLLIKHTCCIGDTVTLLIRCLFLLKVVVVLCYHCLDLLAGFCLVFPNSHRFTPP